MKILFVASSSSSGVNIGSPKPEKRQANSPLPPPPPAASPDISLSHDRSHTPKNLDDMYAKVHKNKKKVENVETEKPKEKLVTDTTSTSSTSSSTSVEEKKGKSVVGGSENEVQSLKQEHNYETLRKSRKCSDPGYEKIKPSNDNCGSEPGYASINGPDSITSSDPGYEVLRQNASSQSDPNYEELRHHNSSASDCGYTKIASSTKNLMDGYSVVSKTNNLSGKSGTSSSYESDSRENNFDEPNYESMPSETASEHNYAALKSNDSESDPNYESVKYLDDPPYERLHDDDSSKSDGTASGYEKVQVKTDGGRYETLKNTNDEEKTDPPYERLDNDSGADSTETFKIQGNTDNETIKKNKENPGYETIRSAGDADGEFDDDGIVQV